MLGKVYEELASLRKEVTELKKMVDQAKTTIENLEKCHRQMRENLNTHIMGQDVYG